MKNNKTQKKETINMKYGLSIIAIAALLSMLMPAMANAQETAAPDDATAQSDTAQPSEDEAIGKADQVPAAPSSSEPSKSETTTTPPAPSEAESTSSNAVEPKTAVEKNETTAKKVSAKGEASKSVTETKKATPVDAQSSVPDTHVKVPAKRSSASNSLGLSPGIPEISTLPGGVAPVFDGGAASSSAWQFNFHGMIYVPLRFGIGKRENPGADQKKTVFHAPARVPGDFETFGYTSTIPNPWTQLNFSYGNSSVIANVIIAARTVSSANGYVNPPDMLGINDAYITFLGNPSEKTKLQLNMGAFANRYGNMGEFDLGRFNTPLIARVAGTGLTGTSVMTLCPKLTLIAEFGYQGQFAKAPVGVEPAGWNGFADPNVGSSYAAHGHISLNVSNKMELGGHYIRAFTRDDRAGVESTPDGSISVVAADLRLTLGRFGHLYTGFARTTARTAQAVSNVIHVLNAPGGTGLINEYLGPQSNGNGALTSLGLQYDLSLGNLLRHPSAFEGNAPDLLLSLFAIYTHVKSDDNAYSKIDKMKFGTELGYLISKWLTLGARYDIVSPELGESAKSHEIISGRVIFHSNWNSKDQLVLQYSHFRTGDESAVREGYPPVDNLTIVPDDHVVSITASMWW